MNPKSQSSSTLQRAYAGKRVLVTGHTGFKGAWLCEWLLALGADVTGLALAPDTTPSLFDQLGLASRLKHRIGDIRDLAVVKTVVDECQPEFVFHLAAQPLVRLSYAQPVETYATNVMGTVHVLDALRAFRASSGNGNHANAVSSPIAAVMVTTDKCYENREWVHSYREEDPLGGYDPYSSSKGAAEIVIAAYRRSFFSPSIAAGSASQPYPPGIRLASARAGNVIGGGDWAQDRIIPDCIRALREGQAIPVRNKVATRPWQHVLEPLSGYLWLGARLAGREVPAHLGSAFNFGPALASNRTVADLVQEVLRHWPGHWEDRSDPKAVHEAKLLNLATDKAHHFLGWSPVWAFDRTIAQTVQWYRQAEESPEKIGLLTRGQIGQYMDEARRQGLPWAT